MLTIIVLCSRKLEGIDVYLGLSIDFPNQGNLFVAKEISQIWNSWVWSGCSSQCLPDRLNKPPRIIAFSRIDAACRVSVFTESSGLTARPAEYLKTSQSMVLLLDQTRSHPLFRGIHASYQTWYRQHISPFKDLTNYLYSKMCWQRWKTPVKFPDCKGKSQGNCIEFDPPNDHIQWCVEAEKRGSMCNPVTPTSQGSSTKCGHNCPAHR